MSTQAQAARTEKPTPTSTGEQRVLVARLAPNERLVQLLENGAKIVEIDGQPVVNGRLQPRPQK